MTLAAPVAATPLKRREHGPVRVVAGLVATLLLLLEPADSAAAENDARLWTTLQGTYRIGTDWELGGLVQLRFAEHISELERILLDPWITKRIERLGIALSLGYDAHLIRNPMDFTENIIWQQVAVSAGARSFELALARDGEMNKKPWHASCSLPASEGASNVLVTLQRFAMEKPGDARGIATPIPTTLRPSEFSGEVGGLARDG